MATNLFGRGMDIERVNIVFNYDMPDDSDTYLHRVSHINEALESFIVVLRNKFRNLLSSVERVWQVKK